MNERTERVEPAGAAATHLCEGVWDQWSLAVAERRVSWQTIICIRDDEVCDDEGCSAIVRHVEGNGVLDSHEGTLRGLYHGEQAAYQLKLAVPTPAESANGLTVRYRIRDWSSIRYLAIGHTLDGQFRHIKIPNPAQGEWVVFSVAYGDIAYWLNNSARANEAESIGDIRLYVSGEPSQSGAWIEFEWGAVWHEEEMDPGITVKAGANTELFNALTRYFARSNPDIFRQVDAFFRHGACPMVGKQLLEWPIDQSIPNGLTESGTYRYLWHAMQPAISMMVYAAQHDSEAAVYAARDYITHWLERSFFNEDPDRKYAWYDHGTAERLMALLMMRDFGLQKGFDFRFMGRLDFAIIRHAQLLESEAFYAYHQPTRYHNHAWFQDMALMATSLAMQPLRFAERWLDRSLERLEDQLNALIVRDIGYAIFVENSIGYHHGIQRLVQFAGDLAGMSLRSTSIPAIAKELAVWSALFRYPDGRAPSHGDTFRIPNAVSTEDKISRGKAYEEPAATVLTKAGYAVLKGNHKEKPFVLCMFATSLSRTHKHEDDLSITLWFDGIEWLIDPSFYSHDYADGKPRFLRTAQAHNKVCIPHETHSIDPGATWLEGNDSDAALNVQGQSVSYEGLSITRWLSCPTNSLEISCRDEVSWRSQRSPAHLVFHCGEGVRAVLHSSEIILDHPLSDYSLRISLRGDASITSYSGWDEQRQLNGIAGAGFQESRETSLISVAMGENELEWHVFACRKNE